MRLERVTDVRKGWLAGPWDSELPIAVGFATTAVDEPHLHTRITEIFLVARGSSTVSIERERLEVTAGDVVIVEPGEAHTFLASSDDYFHFVVHVPGSAGDDAHGEKQPVSRSRLES